MRRPDVWVAGAFLLLGVGILLSSFGFPAGMGRLPGPGFFPAVIGAAITCFSVALLWSAFQKPVEESASIGGRKTLAITIGLLIVFLALWGVVPFPVRTVVFVAVFLRLVGETWLRSVVVAAALTTAVVLAFQYGLRVSLG
jgi:putative tricarboxylic transport membrane protein